MGVPASNVGGGECFAFPDTCNTPTPAGPVPIPYPNTGMLLQAVLPTAALTVFIAGMNAAVETTEIMMSNGDNAGVAGGVISGTFMGPCVIELGSTGVLIEGRGAAYLGSMTGHNNTANCNMPAGSQIVLSQPTVLVRP